MGVIESHQTRGILIVSALLTPVRSTYMYVKLFEKGVTELITVVTARPYNE